MNYRAFCNYMSTIQNAIDAEHNHHPGNSEITFRNNGKWALRLLEKIYADKDRNLRRWLNGKPCRFTSDITQRLWDHLWNEPDLRQVLRRMAPDPPNDHCHRVIGGRTFMRWGISKRSQSLAIHHVMWYNYYGNRYLCFLHRSFGCAFGVNNPDCQSTWLLIRVSLVQVQ